MTVKVTCVPFATYILKFLAAIVYMEIRICNSEEGAFVTTIPAKYVKLGSRQVAL